MLADNIYKTVNVQIIIKPVRGETDTKRSFLNIEILANNNTISNQQLMISPVLDDQAVFEWLVYQCQNLFYKYLPAQNISFEFSPQLSLSEGNVFERLKKVVSKTNAAIQKYLPLKQAFASNNRIMIYEVSKSGIGTDLYENLKQDSPDNILLMHMHAGWNSMKRVFEKPDCLSVEKMIETIGKEKISKILSINMYYINHLLASEHIYFQAVLHHLNISYIVYDFDTYELLPSGHFSKSVMNNPECLRFSTNPNTCLHWDQKLNLRNVVYAPMYKSISQGSMATLHPDYGIFMASNARLDFVKKWFPSIFLYLETTQPQTVYSDFQMTYYTALSFLRQIKDIDFFTIAKLESKLASIFVAVMSFLKYEVIHSIKTERHISLYGDKAWENIFPQYYQNKYLSNVERQELLAQNRHLQIFFNQTYSYLENNPVHVMALNEGHPFLCYPALVPITEFESLKAIEYHSSIDLNEKIETAGKPGFNDTIKEGISNFHSMYQKSQGDMRAMILGSYPDKEAPYYFRRTQESYVMIQKMIPKYFQSRQPAFMTFLDDTFFGRKATFDIKSSPYYNREFVTRILSLS